MNVPYTYLIGWPEYNRWYYGVRYSKNCHPSDLWTTYFTSSKHVKNFISQYGQPSIIKVRKTFDNIESAREHEHKVLRRLKVTTNECWLNKTHNKSRPAMYGNDNPSTKPENRKKIADNTPRQFGDKNPMKRPEVAQKVSKSSKGRKNWWCTGELNAMKNPLVIAKHSESLLRGVDHPNTGKTHEEVFGEKSAEYKLATTLRFKGIPKEKIQCPHCEKIGGKNTMGRWHFDNCKMKQQLS